MSVHLGTHSRLSRDAGVGRICKLIVQPRANFTGVDHEAFRRRAYEMKGEASDECQIAADGWLQYANVIWSDDFNRAHEVLEAALSGGELNFVAPANIAQRTKESVSVTGQRYIAPFAGQSRIRKVTYGSPQVRRGVALNHDGVEPQSGHLKLANDIAFRQNARFRESSRLLEFLQLEGLIGMGASEYEACVAQREKAERKKEVAAPTENARAHWRAASHLLRERIHFLPDFGCTAGCFSAASK
jgi:hypothetical protein